MKPRKQWNRTVRLTIEEVLMDVACVQRHCMYEHYYTCEVDVSVHRDGPDPSQWYNGNLYTEDFKIVRITQYRDCAQGLSYTKEQMEAELPSYEVADIYEAIETYISGHESTICQQAADDEQGAYEYAQEQKFQASRDER